MKEEVKLSLFVVHVLIHVESHESLCQTSTHTHKTGRKLSFKKQVVK